jgi:uncharacterized protein (DUF2147 family)
MKAVFAWTMLFGSILIGVTLGAARAAASPVDGTWIIDDLVLDIFDCQNLVCGRIVGIRDANRRPRQCGMTIVWGLAPTAPSEWTGGSILDPDDSSVYRLSARLQPDGALNARIFKGIELIGKTKILRRIDLRTFPGRC